MLSQHSKILRDYNATVELKPDDTDAYSSRGSSRTMPLLTPTEATSMNKWATEAMHSKTMINPAIPMRTSIEAIFTTIWARRRRHSKASKYH